jgi:hypothetical protein
MNRDDKYQRCDGYEPHLEPVAHAASMPTGKNHNLLKNLSSFLSSPLRHCLSGQEQQRVRAILANPSQSVPSLRASVCSNVTHSTADESVAFDQTVGKHNLSRESGECISVSDELNVTAGSYTTVSSMTSENLESEYDFDTSDKAYSFLTFRMSYLFVTLVVMLADGLQGQ